VRREPPQRSHPVRQRTANPYERLRQGVLTDETFGAAHNRARWSFFRNIAPAYVADQGQEAHVLATLRFDEWFLFDLILPGLHMPAAERWVRQRVGAHGWSAREEERFRRYTDSLFGLFRVVERLGGNRQRLEEFGTDTRLVAIDPRIDQPWPEGCVLLGRLFPNLDTTWEISPATTPLGPAVVRGLEQEWGALPDIRALPAEALFGANFDWIPEAIGTALLERSADEFFACVSSESVSAGFLTEELAAASDPSSVAAQLLRDLDAPLTPLERPLAAGLALALWAGHASRKSGDPAVAAEVLRRKVTETIARADAATLRPCPEASPTQAAASPPDEAFRLSQHETVRLGGLPQVSSAEWIGDRVEVATPLAREDGTLVQPHLVIFVERRDGRIVGGEIVMPDEPADVVLRVLVHTLTRPAFGPPRRPGRVLFRRAATAARLNTALAPINVDAGTVYIAPQLTDAVSTFNGVPKA
jgi:hypothetical protein